MKFFFPDSQDQIDPSFDFTTEERSPLRVRQRDDQYAHEVLSPVPYQGLLVSKAMIDRFGGAGRYSAQQRQRFYRVGVREFFRLDEAPGRRIETLGDCGAFSYVNETKPPYSVDEVIDFYEVAGFDGGLSVDHLIPVFKTDHQTELLEPAWQDRYELTLRLAREFMVRHNERRCRFQPIGVAQGWSPNSYADAVRELQGIGYQRIAIGGLVPLKTPEVLQTLESVAEVRDAETELHLLGITRCEHIGEFSDYGATSFDSTSPFRQAFKDDRDNYWTTRRTYVALRIPQVDGNAKLQARIRAGTVDHDRARRLERSALQAVTGFDRGEVSVEDTVLALREYEELYDGQKDRSAAYADTLEAAPWKKCGCAVCNDVGIHAAVFRGTERNKRRGFHNLSVFSRRLRNQLRSVARAERLVVA